jgi:hypothetical protein
MTISSAVNKVQISSGSTITITNLEAQNASEVLVTKTSAAGVDSTLVITTDYTIDTDLTTVTLNVALAASEKATATLNVPITQTTDYKNASPFNAETAETALDKLTLIVKQQQEELDRAVQFAISDTSALAFDSPSGNANKYLKLSSDETTVEYDTISSSGGLASIVEDTTPQLGGDLDANGNNILVDDATGIHDDSDNELIIFQKTASAVNQIDITNAATGSGPTIEATGDDANVPLSLRAKGTGTVGVGGSALVVDNGATGPGEVRFLEDSDNGTNYMGFKSPAANYV